MPVQHRSTVNGDVRVRVDIGGETLTIRGATTEQHLKMLADVVDGHIARVREAHPNIARHHAAILAALHIADELLRVHEENALPRERLEKTT